MAVAGMLVAIPLATFVPSADANTNIQAWSFDSDPDTPCFAHRGYDGAIYRASNSGSCAGGYAYMHGPLNRSPVAHGSAQTFYMDGTCASPGIQCVVSSYDPDGIYLGGHSNIGTGTFDQAILLNASDLNFWSYTSLECNFPGNQGTGCILYGIDVTEWNGGIFIVGS